METTMSNMIGGLREVDKRSSNDKMEKATQSIREMEKHMNTGLMWVAEAIKDRCEETDKVEEENKLLRKQIQESDGLVLLLFVLNILAFLLGIATDRYGFPK
jgi:uncharacterized ion transporter superfamily protein YfcC